MKVISVLLFLLSPIALIVGLIKPTIFQKIKIHNRKSVLLVFGGLFIASIIMIAMTTPTDKEPKPTTNTEQNTPTQTDESATKTLGVSYNQMMYILSNFFTMEKSTPVKGEDRYMGTTSNNLLTLEIIGKKDNITRASIIAPLPPDNFEINTESSVLLAQFLKNAIPEWKESTSWVADLLVKIEKITDSSDYKEEKVY